MSFHRQKRRYFILLSSFLLLLSLTCWAVGRRNIVIVRFKTQADARAFVGWMSGEGEQNMALWMDEKRPSLAKIPKYDYENLIIDFTQ